MIWAYGKSELFRPLHPVFHFHPWHRLEVFDVIGHDRQAIVQCSGSYKDVEVANLLVKRTLLFFRAQRICAYSSKTSLMSSTVI